MNYYKALNKQVYSSGNYSLVPIRMEDRYDIMRWRNEQMYHLRQNEPLTKEKQDHYFENVVAKLFDQEKPDQILFSYLEGEKCIGYGGLVHVNWNDRNAEISFVLDTALEELYFQFHWFTYLNLIHQIAFNDIDLHKIFIYAFDLRPQLYEIAEKAGFVHEATLKEHKKIEDIYINVIIHSKIKKI